MRFLVLIFLFGFAAARYYRDPEFEEARDKVLHTFKKILDNGPSLREALDMPYFEELDEVDEEVKKGIMDHLKEKFDELFRKVKDKVETGKDVAKKIWDELVDTSRKLKDLGGDIAEDQKGFMEKMKDKVKDFFRKILDIFKKKEARNVGEEISTAFKEQLERFLRKIIERLDIEKIKEYIREKFENSREVLKDLDEESLERLRKFLDLILGKSKESRSIKELWDKVKEWGKKVGIQIKEKFMNFGEWLKNHMKEFVEKVKDHANKYKEIAIEIIKHSKELSKEAALEALEFFEPHKQELGNIWNNLKENLQKVIRGESE